jgi:hypothetical protein
VQADEVHSRDLPYDSALMDRLAVSLEDREIDPWKVMIVTCAPDYILYIERATVCQ